MEKGVLEPWCLPEVDWLKKTILKKARPSSAEEPPRLQDTNEALSEREFIILLTQFDCALAFSSLVCQS